MTYIHVLKSANNDFVHFRLTPLPDPLAPRHNVAPQMWMGASGAPPGFQLEDYTTLCRGAGGSISHFFFPQKSGQYILSGIVSGTKSVSCPKCNSNIGILGIVNLTESKNESNTWNDTKKVSEGDQGI